MLLKETDRYLGKDAGRSSRLLAPAFPGEPGGLRTGARPSDRPTRRLRVAFVITRGDSLGGASVHVRDLGRLLVSSGHEVKVFIGRPGPVVDALIEAGVPHHSLRHLRREVSPAGDLRALWELRQALRRFRPDIVSTHTSKAGALGRLAGWSLGLPVVYTPHCWSFVDGFPNARLYLWIERLIRPFGRRIIAVSENERAEGLRRRIADAAHLVTVHNGMPDVRPEFRAIPARRAPRLVMVGRCEAQKDHPTLVRALAGLKQLDWTIDFVGDGPQRELVERQVEAAGLADRVRFLGYRTDVATVLRDAQIFVLATNWESFPRSIIEAMRAGLPVVATNVGGTAESVHHGFTGYLVRRNDAFELAARLRELISDPALRTTLGAAGRRRYEKHFTIERMATNTLRVWERVLARQLVTD